MRRIIFAYVVAILVIALVGIVLFFLNSLGILVYLFNLFVAAIFISIVARVVYLILYPGAE